MSPTDIVQKLWNSACLLSVGADKYCNVLRDDGMSYLPAAWDAAQTSGDYVKQLTYLLFLKMADERTRAPYNQESPVLLKWSWPELVKKDGEELFEHYRHTLEALGNKPGLLGLIFNKSQNQQFQLAGCAGYDRPHGCLRP